MRKKATTKKDYRDDPKNAIFLTPAYKAWRLAVFRHDGFKCRHCGRSGKRVRLEADHLRPRCLYPELTYDINNGRTLCHSCHVKTPTYGKKALNYKRMKEEEEKCRIKMLEEKKKIAKDIIGNKKQK